MPCAQKDVEVSTRDHDELPANLIRTAELNHGVFAETVVPNEYILEYRRTADWKSHALGELSRHFLVSIQVETSVLDISILCWYECFNAAPWSTIYYQVSRWTNMWRNKKLNKHQCWKIRFIWQLVGKQGLRMSEPRCQPRQYKFFYMKFKNSFTSI